MVEKKSDDEVIYDKAFEKYRDKTFASHMKGIAVKHKLKWDSTVDKNTMPKVVASYEQFTHKRYGGENQHASESGSKPVKFSQFVASAWEHYK